MRKFLLLTTLVASTLGTGGAFAGSFGRACTGTGQDQWMSLDALKARISEQGYDIRKAKMKAGCAEIYAIGPKGERVELYVDPASGKIVGQE